MAQAICFLPGSILPEPGSPGLALGEDAGTFGWSGAAGTVGFVNTRIGRRAGLYVQYMPSSALPIGDEFRKALLTDVSALKKAA